MPKFDTSNLSGIAKAVEYLLERDAALDTVTDIPAEAMDESAIPVPTETETPKKPARKSDASDS